MSNKFFGIFALATICGSLPAHAYFRGNLQNQGINYQKPTSVLVVGHSKDQGDLFIRASITRGRKIREIYPNRQVVIIVSEERSSGFNADYSLSEMRKQGRLGNYARIGGGLSEGTLINELSYFGAGKIESIDFFSHSTPHLGLILQDNFNRADGDESVYRKVTNRFSSKAFAFIHGCNAGFEMAQSFSKNWGIPVAGALTGSDFEFLFEDKTFYPDMDGFKPRNLKKVSQNQLRMKPFPTPYVGRWVKKGTSFERGLPFYKFSCAEGNTDRCLKGIAESMLFWVGPTKLEALPNREAYKASVQDFLCPNHTRDAGVRKRCIENLEASLNDNTKAFNGMYRAKPFDCNLQGCNVKVKCDQFLWLPIPGSCRAELTHMKGGDVPNTMNREYKLYLQAFKVRFGEGAPAPVVTPAPVPAPAPAPAPAPTPAVAAVPVQ